MPQIQQPTRHILQAAQRINCQVAHVSFEKCQYKYCPKNATSQVQEPQHVHLDKLDKHWSKFLKAQQKSSANYIYKNKVFGNALDPTLVKKEAVPLEEINKRLSHMPYIAGLLKEEVLYLLGFMLNLMKLPEQKQKEYMEYMWHRKLLDVDIIDYLGMISRHSNADLKNNQLKVFEKILKHLKDTYSPSSNISYYNPKHLFIKSVNEINPYELEHLNMLLHSDKKLTSQQSMYLAKFVYKLQELNDAKREEYLKFLREKNILPFKKFEYLIIYLIGRAKRIDQNKLKELLKELETLMDIGPCLLEPEPVTPKVKSPPITAIYIDYLKIHKALSHLMKSVIPNIVRLTDLKNFLKDMLTLREDEIVDVFNGLKVANVLNKDRFNYIENFINSGKLGKLDKTKQKEFIQVLKQVAVAPKNMEITLKLSLPVSKGPKRVNFKNKIVANKPAEETIKPSSDLKQVETNNAKSRKNM